MEPLASEQVRGGGDEPGAGVGLALLLGAGRHRVHNIYRMSDISSQGKKIRGMPGSCWTVVHSPPDSEAACTTVVIGESGRCRITEKAVPAADVSGAARALGAVG